ncbi:MAG TPA: potassium channel family protein [Nocardioides sp.]|nr:potassium channel family protein [Nocardioides sp.]
MVGWRRWAHLALILVAVVAVYFVVPVSPDLQRNTLIRVLVAILVLAVMAAGVVRQLRQHIDDTDRRVDGLIVSIAVVVAVFSLCFYTLEQRDPSQFDGMRTRLDALYFTVATAATVGYGDVHAVGQAARALVLVQMAFNVVFIGTAVALLSSRIRAVATARAESRTAAPKPE